MVEEEVAIGRVGVHMATSVGQTAAEGACLSKMSLRVLLRLLLCVLLATVFLLRVVPSGVPLRPAPTRSQSAFGPPVDPTGASKFVHTPSRDDGRSRCSRVALGFDDVFRGGRGTSLRPRPRVLPHRGDARVVCVRTLARRPLVRGRVA